MRIRLLVLAFGAIALTALSGSIVFKDVRFTSRAQEVDAAVIAEEQIHRRNNPTTKLRYQFTDSKTLKSRQESDEFHRLYKPKFSTTQDGLTLVKVQYIPGQPGESRLSGNTNQFYVIAFMLMVAFILWCMHRVKKKARTVRGAGRASRLA